MKHRYYSRAPASRERHGHYFRGIGPLGHGVGDGATFAEPFHVKRKTGDWKVDINAKHPLDIAVIENV